jgi:hypothetical protein
MMKPVTKINTSTLKHLLPMVVVKCSLFNFSEELQFLHISICTPLINENQTWEKGEDRLKIGDINGNKWKVRVFPELKGHMWSPFL